MMTHAMLRSYGHNALHVPWRHWLTGVFLIPCTGQTPLVVYYSKVGLELAKLVVRGQNLNPP